jgi:hypothetical protein
VTFTDRPPRLSGAVTTPDGRVADDSTVILFPADPAARTEFATNTEITPSSASACMWLLRPSTAM